MWSPKAQEGGNGAALMLVGQAEGCKVYANRRGGAYREILEIGYFMHKIINLVRHHLSNCESRTGFWSSRLL